MNTKTAGLGSNPLGLLPGHEANNTEPLYQLTEEYNYVQYLRIKHTQAVRLEKRQDGVAITTRRIRFLDLFTAGGHMWARGGLFRLVDSAPRQKATSLCLRWL